MRKKILLVVVPLAALSAFLFFSVGGEGRALIAPQASVPTWGVSGLFSETCSCDPICPCWFDKKPTLGHCNNVLMFKVEKSHYGQVRLDGLVVVVVTASEGESAKARLENLQLVALYVDESTTPAQRQAVEEIWGNHLFAGFKASSGGLKAVRLRADIKPDYAKVSIPNILNYEVKEWKGNRAKLVSHVHGWPFTSDLRQGSSVNHRYDDYGLNWNYRGKSASFSRFKANSPS